ncbi:MAG: hypothetical protein AB1679_25875 [Actinomycetota bacterium]
MADWACYIDEPHYQDPEVAVADGYSDIPLPPGALTLLAVDTAALERLDPGRPLRRSWRAVRPVVIGEELHLTVSVGDGSVTGRFRTAGGDEIVEEQFGYADELAATRGTPVFRTGVIDLTRRRALAWSASQFRPGGAWSWGNAPMVADDLCWRLIAPGLLVARAALSGPGAARRISGIHVVAAAGPPVTAQPLVVETQGAPAERTWVVLAGDEPVARVTVELTGQ